MTDAPYIAVIGTSRASQPEESTAERVGAELARAGAVVICGGGPGVMLAASRGAAQAGGTVIGILPGGRPLASQRVRFDRAGDRPR